ncbi:MAG: SGNH/GDSL hydrolase family protein [Verrucomicrobia bacterium]|nr:SGNH/GDSL hydrolase family protein [Verrucomicrobiota bacterium]
MQSAPGQELEAKQRERLAVATPKLLAKLEQHAPIHVIVLGDSVSNYFLPGGAEDSEVFLKAYHSEFLRRLADRFFYTGGVRDIKPRKGDPENLFPSVGPEITVHNLARNGAVVLQALQWLTTDAFDNPSDLAIINFGINDAGSQLGTVRYSQILNRCVQLCMGAGAEVLVLGCSVESGADPRFLVGATRPYAMAAKRVAEANGSTFIDLGDASVRAPRQKVPKRDDAFSSAVRTLETTLFSHDPPAPDKVHLAARGHRLLGRALADRFFDGVPERGYEMSAIFHYPQKDEKQAALSLRLVNRSDKERSGVLCPLTIGQSWRPAEQDLAFTLAPSATLDIKVPYNAVDDDPFDGRISPFHGIITTSFVIVDQVEQRLYDVDSVCYPVSVDWPVRGMIEIRDQFSFTGTVRNNTRESLSGRYRAEWHGQVQQGELLVGANEKQALTFTFKVPEDVDYRVKESLTLEVTAGGKNYRFHSLVEASRAFSLNQRIPLVHRTDYLPNATGGGDGTDTAIAEFQASERALLVIVDLKDKPLVSGPGAVRVDFTLDARPFSVRDEPGYAGTVSAIYGASDGPADIKKLTQAAFGEGYDRDLDMAYVKAFTSTRSDGVKRFTIEDPRAYFYLHEWLSSSAESNLGVNLVVTLQTTDPETGQPVFLPENSFALVDSGVHRDDSDGLGTLELVDQASGRWTIRIH